MNARSSSVAGALRLLSLLLLAAGFSARAADLSGTYADEGTHAAAGAATGSPVSFVGLMRHAFDPELNRALLDGGRTIVRHNAARFSIECRDGDDKTAWSGQWEKGRGYTPGDDNVVLLTRDPTAKDDGFQFVLRQTSGGEILVVEASRVRATTFGPAAEPIGTYIFPREK
jgi:hypothetical protein